MVRRLLVIVVLFVAACSSNEPEAPLPTLFVMPDSVGTLTAEPSPSVTNVVVQESTSQPGTLQFWQPMDSTLTPGQTETWNFTGQADDEIIVRVVGVDAVLTLQDPQNIDLNQGETIAFTLPVDGEYTVLVDLMDDAEGGEYQIGLSYANQPNPNETQVTPIPLTVGVPTPMTFCNDLGQLISRLESNETIGGTIENNNHIYTFESAGNAYAEVEMRRVSGELDPQVTIYDADCTPLATDDDSAGEDNAFLKNIQLPEDGFYIVQASGRGLNGDYTLRLLTYPNFAPVTPTVVFEPTNTPTPMFMLPTPAPGGIGSRLEPYIPLVNTLDEPGDIGIHAFDVPAGQVITIGVTSTSNPPLLPEIELIGPEGNILGTASSNPQGEAVITNLRVELEGAYQIFIRGAQNTTGVYQVSFGWGSTREDVLKGVAPFGQELTGSINRQGIRDVWAIPLREGDIITAAVTPNSALDPIIDLVLADDPERIIAVDDNGGGNRTALIQRLTITQDGLYLLRIRAVQAATTGEYTFVWRYVTTAPTDTPQPATSPILITDDTIEDNSYLFYPFQGRANQLIRIRVIGVDDFDPVAALIGADGEILIEVDDVEGDADPQFEYTLPADGTYTLRVNGYLTTGDFQIFIEELFK